MGIEREGEQKMTSCYIFADEEHVEDTKNLLLPVDATLYIHGLDPGEKIICEQVAKQLHVFNKLKEHGVVMVICERMPNKSPVQIDILGAEAIEDFLGEYFKHSNRSQGILNLANV